MPTVALSNLWYLCFAGGGVLVTTFGPELVPEGWRGVAALAGFACMAIGLIGLSFNAIRDLLSAREKRMGLFLLVLSALLGAGCLATAILGYRHISAGTGLSPPDAADSPRENDVKSVEETRTSGPYYSQADVDQILLALRETNTLLQQDGIPAREGALQFEQAWDHLLGDEGKQAFLEQEAIVRARVEALNEGHWAIRNRFSHYSDELSPIFAAPPVLDDFFKGSNRVREAVPYLANMDRQTVAGSYPLKREYNEGRLSLDSWISVVSERGREATKRFRLIPRKDEPAAGPGIRYSERDIRELLDGLGDAHDLVEKSIGPITNEITGVAANWRGFIPNMGVQKFAAYLKELDARIPEEVWKRIDAFLEKYPRVSDQMRTALVLDDQAARGEISRSLRVAIEALEKLPENPPPSTYDLVSPSFKDAYAQGEIASAWVNKARGRIAEMNQSVRIRGVTGYEQAGAQP